MDLLNSTTCRYAARYSWKLDSEFREGQRKCQRKSVCSGVMHEIWEDICKCEVWSRSGGRKGKVKTIFWFWKLHFNSFLYRDQTSCCVTRLLKTLSHISTLQKRRKRLPDEWKCNLFPDHPSGSVTSGIAPHSWPAAAWKVRWFPLSSQLLGTSSHDIQQKIKDV